MTEHPDTEEQVKEGDLMEFRGDDSYFKGRVVSIFYKRCGINCDDKGPLRCVVQDDRGLLLIKDPKKAVKL